VEALFQSAFLARKPERLGEGVVFNLQGASATSWEARRRRFHNVSACPSRWRSRLRPSSWKRASAGLPYSGKKSELHNLRRPQGS
jgi:hypothetical protein